ncbi:kinase-like domain-containing protein [Suillus ampliporus]|nr:kinase-like domain-containing protein [Suillus ampliporus]
MTLLAKVDQTIQRTSNPNDMLGGNLAYLNTVAFAAGTAGVIQGGEASQQPWPQSVSPTPSFGMNPGVSAPSTADRRSTNPVGLDEQLGMPSAPQGAFPNCVPTAGLSMIPNRMPPPQMAGTEPAIQSGPPTQEQLAHAVDVIKNLKRVFSTKPPTMQLHVLPDNQRMEYNQLLEQLHKMTQDLDVNLPMYWIVLRSNNMIRNLVAIVSLVAHQRASYWTGSNLVVIDPSALKSMYGLLQKAIEYFEQRYQMLEAAVAPQQMGRGLTGLLINRPSPPPTAPNAIPSTRCIPQMPVPDLTGLITRCSQDPVSGGTYGNIYRCIYHGPEGDVMVAVKAMRPQFLNTEIMLVFRRELGIWKRLQHPNILMFMGTTEEFGPSVALVAPWIVNNTLTSFLNKNNETLARRNRLLLLRDVAAGLDYLHTFSFTVDGHTYSNPVVHGDLTGNNILIGNDETAYLADFGLSGTLTKLPESASAITTQSDIYSFGSVMLQVLTGDVPWRHLANDFAIWLKVVGGGKKSSSRSPSCLRLPMELYDPLLV